MSRYSAQGSITIKRLRNGDTISLVLELNGKPLFQSIDNQTGAAKPSFEVAANQPIITPKAASTRGNAVTLSAFHWSYNGEELSFTGSTDSAGYKADSTGKFAMNADTGALKIIGNLANKNNTANDTILFRCTATVAGIEYSLTKSIDFQIQSAGASSYYGFINASTMMLNGNISEAVLDTELWLSAAEVTDFYVRWYKGDSEMTANRGKKSITVGRDDINASQLFIAEFYLSSDDADYVFRAGISIIDTLDEINLVPYISSDNKLVDTNKPVTVAARIIKASNGSVLTPSSPAYSWQIMDGDTWQVLGSGTDPTITVSTDHTDNADGSQHDVEVLVQVSFDSLT